MIGSRPRRNVKSTKLLLGNDVVVFLNLSAFWKQADIGGREPDRLRDDRDAPEVFGGVQGPKTKF